MSLGASNVSVDCRSFWEIAAVDLLKLAINLRGKDALMSESLKCKPESTKPSEDVNEPHWRSPDWAPGFECDGLNSPVTSKANLGVKGLELTLML